MISFGGSSDQFRCLSPVDAKKGNKQINKEANEKKKKQNNF